MLEPCLPGSRPLGKGPCGSSCRGGAGGAQQHWTPAGAGAGGAPVGGCQGPSSIEAPVGDWGAPVGGCQGLKHWGSWLVAQGQTEFPWLRSSGGWQSSVCPGWGAWVPAEAGEGEWRSSRCSRGQGRHYLAQKGLQVLPVQSGLVTGSVILEPRKEKRSTQLPQPWRRHRGRRAYGRRGYFPPH